ncbi:hypothetical protein BLNAU_22114 [Blattamonas nauphoetae]|uniref:Uncharacterized protein n=1 Tax=Blattamonas nauphoetae TaxID=2049346 RepID=A0ABQ9WY77_9EUKA|nr:hypothetical protein BLNAU_22114 [Blattamonas nauphoetae]
MNTSQKPHSTSTLETSHFASIVSSNFVSPSQPSSPLLHCCVRVFDVCDYGGWLYPVGLCVHNVPERGRKKEGCESEFCSIIVNLPPAPIRLSRLPRLLSSLPRLVPTATEQPQSESCPIHHNRLTHVPYAIQVPRVRSGSVQA